MPIDAIGSNLVIAAHNFNPSIFSQLWLVRNQIVGEEEFRAGCVFSDQAVNVESDQFALLVIPPQMQLVPKVAEEEQACVVAEKGGLIIRALPHTPYTAVGLNFFWLFEPASGDVSAWTRSLFFDSGRKICRFFDPDDARFGAYFSKDTLGCRLKLDIKPITRQVAKETKESVQFAFNFHLDLPQEGNRIVAAIERQLGIWDAARNEAAQIVEQITA